MPPLSRERAVELIYDYLCDAEIGVHEIEDTRLQSFINMALAHPDVSVENLARPLGVTREQIDNRRVQRANPYYFTSDSDSITLNISSEPPTQPQISRYTYSPNSLNLNANLGEGRVGRVQSMSVSDFLEVSDHLDPTEPPRSEEDLLDMYYNSRPRPEVRRPQRSEKDMVLKYVRSEEFPRPNFIEWSDNRKLQQAINAWFSQCEYRDNWIFARREREGFNRRNVGHFNLDDVMSRMSKRKNGHTLDTETSKFYDWKLGGTDFILRLELYQVEGKHFLISRYIFKPENVEIKFDIKYWSERSGSFKPLYSIMSEKNNEGLFERVVGRDEGRDIDEDYSYDSDSDYYEDGEDYDGDSY